jgi:acyl-coenzyme A synthetase/AMP-(fatty) acid ligase
MSADGQFTKLGRTDDRINLGGTRMFSGKIEAELERLPTVIRAAAIRVYSEDGAEALGIAVQPGPDFDAEKLTISLRRALRGIGEIYVKTMPSIPADDAGQVDRNALELAWPNLPNAI